MAEKEIEEICKLAQADGQIGPQDFFKVSALGAVRHHFNDENDKPQNENRDGALIDRQWPPLG